MKLRQVPEDFTVEEIAGFSIKQAGDYKLYLLDKKNLETFALLSYLSKQNGIPVRAFGIAGIKDRHAVTRQYLTIPTKYNIHTKEERNFNITHIGYVDKSLRPGMLKGNRFEIVVRSVKKGELDGIYMKAKTVAEAGVPNYFDSQRFGSVIEGFIAKQLVLRDYEKAVKMFLTQYTSHENANVREEKKLILSGWPKLTGLRVKTRSLAIVIEEYNKKRSWLSAYKAVPRNLREMYVSAYQSYLWNECVKEILRRKIDDKYLYPIEYAAGKLMFFKRSEEIKDLPVRLSLISHDMVLDKENKDVIKKILSKEGITLEQFDIKGATGNFFKTHERDIILKPEDFHISEPQTDEMNGKNNFYKIILKFTLTKGGYATIVTKRLFNE